jgi:hypothetical protein
MSGYRVAQQLECSAHDRPVRGAVSQHGSLPSDIVASETRRVPDVLWSNGHRIRLAQVVSSDRREIGIRMALGAERTAILRWALREGPHAPIARIAAA